MTRLFFRFYLGVLIVLVAAAGIQHYVTEQRNNEHNQKVAEDALGGGVRLARDAFRVFPGVPQTEMLGLIQQQFNYPVTIVPVADETPYVSNRLASGDDVVVYGTAEGGMVATQLANSADVLRFGPLPEFMEASQRDQLLGLAAILAVAAIAIALLLRPVAAQFRLIESTALQVAGGNLNARIDESRTKSTRPLARAFNNVAARTEALLRTQSELLQTVSHELRTPLSRIQFAADLIRTSKTEDEREQRLRSVESAADDLNDLIGELLSYVRMETSEPELHIAELQLAPVISKLLTETALIHPHLEFKTDGDLLSSENIIWADPRELQRAIGNLVSNAARFAKSVVTVSAATSNAETIITVDDDGPGIPERDRERMLEPFARLDESDSGAGLGLALVRRIIAHHEGSIQIDESPASGCRMKTVWPLKRRNGKT